MIIRKAAEKDIDSVARLYERTHTAEERGELTIGWKRGIYPERNTAEAAVERGDLFVLTEGNEVFGSAILNQQQVDVYKDGNWEYAASEDQVMVMHTLVIDPGIKGKGYGRAMVEYYEQYALENGCRFLRMDTNILNLRARALYGRLGYREIGVVPCVFNGLEDVQLLLLEKCLTK